MRSSSSCGIRPLRVVATHRAATKPSDREAEFEWESGRLDSLLVA